MIFSTQNIVLCLCVCGIVMVSACNDAPTQQSNGFDRRVMLKHVADYIIVPAFKQQFNDIVMLEKSVNNFLDSPTPEKLLSAKADWVIAYLSWQNCAMFTFGPGETTTGTLTNNIATFPADINKIENYIAVGDTTLRNFDRDSRGYLAIEYFLFAPSPTEAVQAVQNNTIRKSYIRSVIRDMRAQIQTTSQAWQNGYATTFASDNSTAAGSSISELFNAFSLNFEILKNFKVALPIGLRAGQTKAEPLKVEAYYSGISLALLKKNMNAIENVWYGISLSTTQTVGFKEYLLSVTGGERLVADTETQLATVQSMLIGFGESERFSQLIVSNDSRLPKLSTELQKLTRFLKSEMSSLLGIAITYSSGDGD